MEYLKIVDGDLLNATDDYIVHQCNCISTNAKALAKQIFDNYEYADTYKKRNRQQKTTYSEPGTIEIFGNGDDQRYIINMYAQYYPAEAKYTNDTGQKRLLWFQNCLNHISKIKDIQTKTIAMPFNIGCGAAGGNWKFYHNLINTFANKEKINVTLYKFND